MKTEINLIKFNEDISLKRFPFLKKTDNNEHTISELEMHKLLYFQFGFFYRRFKKELYKYANFQAWKYGSVEMDYRHNNLLKFSKILLSEEEKNFLKQITTTILNLSIDNLIYTSHQTDPWIENFVGDLSAKWKPINKKQICQYFSNKNNIFLKKLEEFLLR